MPTEETVTLARMARIENAIDLFSTVVSDFEVLILESGKVRVFDRNGKRLPQRLAQAIRDNFDAFVVATRADEYAADAIAKAKDFTLDVPAVELNVPSDGFMAVEPATPPAARTRRGRKAGT
ncbi:MAG TPA: hypothetical protein PLE54_07560 [Burkholderiaceae bacterium]|nr:hypothetical protein [Burkholderiaceae bacterium]HQR70442.1 hypothetical protein [Burkholderiaceae bacterium]